MRHLFKIFAFLFCAALALAQSVPIKNATLQGTLNGTPTSGTLNLGSVTLSLGTPSSLTLTNATALPVSGITASTSAALGVGSLNIGHASDTTLARSSAGRLSIEGVNIVGTNTTDALTNKTYEGLTLSTSTGTITITNGKTLTLSNTLTFTGTDGSSVAFGTGGTVLYSGGALGTPSSGVATNLTLAARAGTGGVARTIDAMIKEQAVSVTDYGATGDGTTDDTTAITRALAACISLGRNVLFFPAGTYKLTDEIVLGTGPENLTICGQNYSSKIVQTAANKDCFRMTGVHTGTTDGFTMRDIWLSGPGAGTSTKSGFNCEDVTGTLDCALFERVKITGFKYGMKLFGCSNSKIDSCAAEQNWVGYYIANGTNGFANSLLFVASPASENTKYNVWVESGDCITFQSMDIVGTAEVDLYITGGYNIVLNNARIEANANDCTGLYINSTNSGVTMLNSSIANYTAATNVTSVRIGQPGGRLTMINSSVVSGGTRSDGHNGAIRYDSTINASILAFGSSQGTTVDCYASGTYYGTFGASQWVTDMQSSGFTATAGSLGQARRQVDLTGAETIRQVVKTGTSTYGFADIALAGTTITLTGDVTGSGTGSFATTLATTQSAAHTWNSSQTMGANTSLIFTAGSAGNYLGGLYWPKDPGGAKYFSMRPNDQAIDDLVLKLSSNADMSSATNIFRYLSGTTTFPGNVTISGTLSAGGVAGTSGNTFSGNQTIGTGYKISLGNGTGTDGGALYFREVASTNSRNKMLVGDWYVNGDIGIYYANGAAGNPDRPIFYIDHPNNRTSIGHTAASQPSGTKTLNVEGTFDATGIATALNFKRGAGTPEGAVTGIVGDLYTRTDGGANTTLYVKESGSGNTGWVAK